MPKEDILNPHQHVDDQNPHIHSIAVGVSVEKMVHNIMKSAAEEVMEKTGLRVDSLVFQWDDRLASMGEKFPSTPSEISIMTTS